MQQKNTRASAQRALIPQSPPPTATWTITMQGLTLTATSITAAEKHTLMLDSTLTHDKVTGAREIKVKGTAS